MIDPDAVGRAFEVLVNVDLSLKDVATVTAFEEYVAALDDVIELALAPGAHDAAEH